MWSPTVTAFLLVCWQVFSAANNAIASERDVGCRQYSMCDPDPGFEEMGRRSTCTYVVHEDRKENRHPASVFHYNCICPNHPCREGGDYRCRHVRISIPVYFNNDPSTRTLISVNNSCVCAAPRSAQADFGVAPAAAVVPCGR